MSPQIDAAPPVAASSAPAGLAPYDARPFFEKALAFGIQNRILDAARLEQIATDAPKGMVQIARYFGSEYLRPELERARDRMVNLVSLYLESTCHGDLKLAAESLRDHSFLSRSKGGSDMLKTLLGMPSNSHFGMNEASGFTDDQIPLLAKWTLKPMADYQAELAQRSQAALVIDTAIWLADELGMDEAALQEAGCDGDAVIRTALLALNAKRSHMPDWLEFEKLIAALRKKASGLPLKLAIPKQLPAEFADVVERARQSILADLPKIQDPALPIKKLFCQTPAFIGRYFWIEDALAEIDNFDRSVSDAWVKATDGHDDEGSLLTLFLSIATASPAKTLLTEKAAAALIRKIRKSKPTSAKSADSKAPSSSGSSPSVNSDAVIAYIRDHAPEQHQLDYMALWRNFIAESLPTLASDYDYELKDAMALLRRECNLK